MNALMIDQQPTIQSIVTAQSKIINEQQKMKYKKQKSNNKNNNKKKETQRTPTLYQLPEKNGIHSK